MDPFVQYVRPIDREALRATFRSAEPFPFSQIDDFLDPEFAHRIAREYPPVVHAFKIGRSFSAVNERGKVQITDRNIFPENVRILDDVLSSPGWLDTLSDISGISNLLADELMVGGGMHLMRNDAHLDVHVDFNFIKERRLHRRLNILIFFNEGWREDWGGRLELWDSRVRKCHHRFLPVHNRCVLFETSEYSFHGVEKVSCPEGMARCSFAGYYYTHEAPAGWDGRSHSTVFRARPEERVKRLLAMPAERAMSVMRRPIRMLARAAASFQGTARGARASQCDRRSDGEPRN